MTSRSRTCVAALTLMLLAEAFAAGDPKGSPHLVLRATYDTGLGANGSEIISIGHDGIATLTNVAGSVDILDLSNPLQPRRIQRVAIEGNGTPNSAAVHPQHDYFLVVIGRAGVQGAVAAYRLSDGAFLDSAPVGIQPDSIAISPNGQYAVIANEAESVDIGQNGGPGSLSIVDLQGFNTHGRSSLSVTNIPLPSLAGFPGFSTGRTDDIGRLPIDNTPNTLEPESVTFTNNSRYAYVTLQENNGVVRLDVKTGEMTFFGVGQTTHLADLTNNTPFSYSPVETLTAFREPDGIVLDQTGRFFVTADEGDTRNAAAASGPRGGRTLSVFDAETGAFLGDTGKQLDDAAAAAGLYPDDRSNRGSTEPEVLDLTHHRGLTLVALGLERGNAVALVNVDDPTAPQVVDVAAAGVGPEGVKFFRVRNSLFVAAANEVSGTVSIFEVVF
jgi:uncharacterized protein